MRWGAVLQGQPGISIGCDNAAGGALAGRHLMQRGRRKIAFLGDASTHFPEFFARYCGCDAALREGGLRMNPALQVDADSSEQSGYDAARTLIARGHAFDAIFAASDLIAIGAMKALHERGLRVPEDVAIAGFDDIPMAGFVNPSLSTVQQDTKLAGSMLVENLLRLINDEPVESQTIPVKLALRKSSCAIQA